MLALEVSTSSLMWSIPTATPDGPTIKAMQAVRYPEPDPTSRALAPVTNLSLNSSRACAC